MRLILVICVLLALGCRAAVAEPEDGPRAVISAQIEAFLADDLATAFGFASPGIRALFGSPGNFGVMVQQGYPMVWRPGSVRFLGRAEGAEALLELVEITDSAGQKHVLEYRMISTEAGWRIDGVRLLEAPAVGV